jgi:hypothetical protein
MSAIGARKRFGISAIMSKSGTKRGLHPRRPTRNSTTPGTLPSLFVSASPPHRVAMLPARNTTMGNFASLMQRCIKVGGAARYGRS